MSKVLNKETGEVILCHGHYNPRDSKDFAQDCSNKIIEIYDFTFDMDSRELKVVRTGEEDRDALIQTYAKDCGVYNILAKYALTGDASLLSRRQVMTGVDLTKIPVDDLNPGAASVLAASDLEKLNYALGTHLTNEELTGMSSEELQKLISGIVEAKVKAAVKKEGEE